MNQPDISLPGYDQVQAVLERLQSSLSAAECHGMVCASIVGNSETDAVEHISPTLLGEETGSLVQDADMAGLLARLVVVSDAWFRQGSYDFVMLLPADDEPLSARTQAVAEWCRGFVMGLIEAGVKTFEQLPADAEEVLRDLVTISGLNAEDSQGGTDADLMQVEEYVRVGVQLMYEHLGSGGAKQ